MDSHPDAHGWVSSIDTAEDLFERAVRSEERSAKSRDKSQSKSLLSEAAKYYGQAANMGYAHAQCKFACMCAEGRGTVQDMPQALSFFNKAAAQGHKEAKHYLEIFSRDLKSHLGEEVMGSVAAEARHLAWTISHELQHGVTTCNDIKYDVPYNRAEDADDLQTMASRIEARALLRAQRPPEAGWLQGQKYY